MFCVKCGARLPDGSAFCSACGARLGAGSGANNTPPHSAGGQNQPVRRLGGGTQPGENQYNLGQSNASGSGSMNGRGVRGNTPMRSASSKGAGAAAAGRASQRATGAYGSRMAAKASGGLLKKLLIGAAVVVVGGGIISAVADNGGGNGDTGKHVTSTSSGVKLELNKSVYSPGDDITVKYDGVSSELADNGAWIGMAGHLNDPEEYLNQEYLSEGSGRIYMKAPSSPGDYEVRLFKSSYASSDSMVSDSSIEFTVATGGDTDTAKKKSKVPFDGFDEDMQVTGGTNFKHTSGLLGTAEAKVNEDGDLRILFPRMERNAKGTTSNIFLPGYDVEMNLLFTDSCDPISVFGVYDGKSYDGSLVTEKGETKEYTAYLFRITDFNEYTVTSTRSNINSGETETEQIRCVPLGYKTKGDAILFVFKDGHRQVWTDLFFEGDTPVEQFTLTDDEEFHHKFSDDVFNKLLSSLIKELQVEYAWKMFTTGDWTESE